MRDMYGGGSGVSQDEHEYGFVKDAKNRMYNYQGATFLQVQLMREHASQ